MCFLLVCGFFPPWLHTREPLDSPVLLHLLLRRLLVLARSFICVTCSHNISGCLTQPQIHWLKCYMLLSLFHTPFLFPCLSLFVSRSLAVCKHPVLPVLFHSRLFLSSSPHMNVSCSAAVIITVVFFLPSDQASPLCLSFGDVLLVCAGGSKVPLAGSRSWLITFSSRRLSRKMSLKKKQQRRSPKRK